MICIDSLNDFGDALNRRLGRSSHLVSDLPGEAGTAELVAFARGIGMRATWLQKAGTPHEHFDVFEACLSGLDPQIASAETCVPQGMFPA